MIEKSVKIAKSSRAFYESKNRISENIGDSCRPPRGRILETDNHCNYVQSGKEF